MAHRVITVLLLISIGGGKCNKKRLLNDSCRENHEVRVMQHGADYTDGETLPAHCTHWIKMWQVERSRLPTQEELLRCVKLKADVTSKLNKNKKKEEEENIQVITNR